MLRENIICNFSDGMCFKKIFVILLWCPQMAEFPKKNIDNESQCNVQKNAPNAKHRLCIKWRKVAKSNIKQNP